MSFSYGNFYGMTGIHTLFMDANTFASMLKTDNLSSDTRAGLISLYSEIYAIKQVFDPMNTDPAIPHVSIAIDKSSPEAIAFLRGYNNYLNYKRLQAESIAVDDTPLVDLDDIEIPAAKDDTTKTSIFMDTDTDMNINETLDFNLGLNSELDMDMSVDMDFNAEDSITNDSPREEKTLFSTYNTLYDFQNNDIDLVKWGREYSEEDMYPGEDYIALPWGAAMKALKRDKSDPHTEKFIAQRRKLPTTAVNCSMTPEMRAMICKAMGVDNTHRFSDFEEHFCLKLLAEVYNRATAPATLNFGDAPMPHIDLVLNVLREAIDAPSNVYIQRFGISMCDLALWNSRSTYSLNYQIDSILQTLVAPVCAKSTDSLVVKNTISKMIKDCDLLLGNSNEDMRNVMSKEDINVLLNDCEFDLVSAYTYCEKFLQLNSNLDIDFVPKAAEVLAKYITYCFQNGSSELNRQAIYNLLQSQENLVFITNINIAMEAALSSLRIAIITTYRECDGEILFAPLSVDHSTQDDEQIQAMFIPLFKAFTLFTGLCGCSFSFFGRMFATTYQMQPAVLSVAPVKFTGAGFEHARESIALLKGHLNSFLHRVNKLSEGV